MDYYEKIKKAVEGRLIGWKEDLTVHDKAMLEGYDGEFLHGSRPTGTNTMLLDPAAYEWADPLFPPSSQVARSKAFLLQPNDTFHHGKDGVVRRVSREEAEALVEAFAERIREAEALFTRLHINDAAKEVRGQGYRFWLDTWPTVFTEEVRAAARSASDTVAAARNMAAAILRTRPGPFRHLF